MTTLEFKSILDSLDMSVNLIISAKCRLFSSSEVEKCSLCLQKIMEVKCTLIQENYNLFLAMCTQELSDVADIEVELPFS